MGLTPAVGISRVELRAREDLGSEREQQVSEIPLFSCSLRDRGRLCPNVNTRLGAVPGR